MLLFKRKQSLLLLFIVAAFSVIFALCYKRFYTPQPSYGWKTVNSPLEPSGGRKIISNGQPPADFEVTLVEPESHSPIKVKPAGRCQFLVKIQITDIGNADSDRPPSYAHLKLLKESKSLPILIVPLKLSARDGRTFLYSGEVEAPPKTGDYDVLLEVRYDVFASRGGGLPPKRLDPFQKTVKGAILHVSN